MVPCKVTTFQSMTGKDTLLKVCSWGKWYRIRIVLQMYLENLLFKKALQGTHKNTFVYIYHIVNLILFQILSVPSVHRINYWCPLSPHILAGPTFYSVYYFPFISHPYCYSPPSERYSH